MKELLRLEKVSKRFGPVVAVDSVDLSIYDGEFLAILGPSGSGKTTILRLIAGFETSDEGQILLEDRDIALTPVNQRPFNTVFQDYALFPNMNVFKNIAYGLMVRGTNRQEIRQRVEEALEMVALSGFGERYPDQLSGGQRQRVALARALILRPKLLLLDEPLGALDLALRKQMQITLKQIQEQVKITFVHVTHDQEEGLTMSDRIAIINEGRIQQLDGPQAVYFYPRNYFTANFMGENNLIKGKIADISQARAKVETEIGDVEVKVATGHLKRGDGVFVVIRPENILIGEQARTAVNIYEGVIKRRVFVGSEEKLFVTPISAPELEIMIKLHALKIGSGYPSQGLTRENKIQIGWQQDQCWLVSGNSQ
jgi:ABC-type Fe3+/spermidine/putrescine transport system ATPase subunit